MSGGSGLRALVIETERETPDGLIGAWLRERGARVDKLEIDLDDREIDVEAYDMLVPLGSELAAYDDGVDWIRREHALLSDATEAGVPVLGICFGGQMLARVLGGDAFRAEQAEIGWLRVRSEAPELIPEGPWFQWHFDTFTVPPGARLLADSDVGPQAFTHGPHLGLQFHPEVTPEIMDRWVAAYRHELEATGTSADVLLEQTRSSSREARARTWRLLDTFHERVLGARATG